jgi:hypothetical protein
MSRSRKKAIYKDKGENAHTYWRSIRREWKQKIHSNALNNDFELRNRNEIVNKYDYCDWTYGAEFQYNGKNRFKPENVKWLVKLRRK